MNRRHLTRAVTALVTAALCPTPAAAQVEPVESPPAPDQVPAVPAPPDVPDTSAPPDAEVATLRIVLTMNDAPIPGATVRVEGAGPAVTDARGAAELRVSPGQKPVLLDIPRSTFPAAPQGDAPLSFELPAVDLVVGQTLELAGTFSPAGELQNLDVRPPSVPVPETPPPETQPREVEEPQTKANGRLTGVVRAKEGQYPIGGAKIFVRGTALEGTTDAEGRFVMEVPSGRYGVSIIHPDFSTVTREVQIRGNAATDLVVALATPSVAADDFVITAKPVKGSTADLIEERRKSSNVQDVIGAEEMSRSGDSDAAGALKRVTGITVVGGKYVYVRGMGERYSSCLLNGQQIPSPEPERRVVPLDLFPTEVLESVVIQKTYSPDMPGEFGGGVIQLRTRSFPEGFTAEIGASAGMNTQTTFREAPMYNGGDLDWLGVDDGTRELPGSIRDAVPLRRGDRFTEGYTDDELAGFARRLPNRWNIHRRQVPFNRAANVTVGNKFEIGSVPLGFTASLLYEDEYQRTETDTKRFTSSEAVAGGLQENNAFSVESLERTVSTGGIFVAGAEYLPGEHLRSTTLLLRVSDDRTDVVTGVDSDLGRPIRRGRLMWVERQLFYEQVSGEQKIEPLNDALVNWRYGYSTALRSEPDRREYTYADANAAVAGAPPNFQLQTTVPGTTRNYSDLDDHIHDIGLDYTQPLTLWADLQSKLKVGSALTFRERNVNTVRFTMNAPTGAGSFITPGLLRQPPENIFAPENIDGANGWTLVDSTQGTDAYRAEQKILAGYAMGVVPIIKQVEVMAGTRIERGEQRVATFDPFSPDAEPVVATLDNTDVLPATTLTWRMTDDMNVRIGYGRTVSRPDFRELSPASFRDVTTNTRFEGNPDLQRATLDNYDARWEWYFSGDELVSVGGFYKHFNDPIELVAQGSTDFSFTWDNAESATNLGAEIEGRRRLDLFHPSLELFFVAANVALIRSRVELGDQARAATSRSRPLQGQSPYVINAQFGFDDSDETGSGFSAALLYNVSGRRIAQVGRQGVPDMYEEPFHQLDLVLGQRLGAGFKVSLKGTNLVDPEQTLTQGGRVAERYHTGRTFSLGLSWSY